MRGGVLFLACLLTTASAHAETVRLLVAFGTNDGLPAEQRLRYAEADALRFADTLYRLGDLSAENRMVVTADTAEALANALEAAAERARHLEGEVTFFFYFSGHGDDKNLHIAGKRFPLSRLRTLLAAVPAKLKVSVIDACRSESDTDPKGFSRAPGFAVQLGSTVGLEGAVTLRSSSPGEASQESKQLRGAVFTHYLTTALRGAADRDRDNRVTLEEAYAYAYRQTVRRSARGPGDIMHPSVDLDIEGAGQLVLTRPAPADAVIVLPRTRDAQFLIFDRDSQGVEAEVWGTQSRSIPLRVPAGQYLVHRRGGQQSGAMIVSVGSGQSRILASEEFQPIPEALLASKGGQLELAYQSLAAGYSGQLSHSGAFGQSVNLRYGVGGVYYTGSVGINLGKVEHAYRSDRREERWLGGDVRLARHRVLGPFDAFAGIAWRLIDQEVHRQTDARLTGTAAETLKRAAGVSGGATLGVGWSQRLNSSLELNIEAGGTFLGVKEGTELAFRPEGGLEVGLVARF